MKKILMVGAGIGQLFLSKKIKEKGYQLLTVTQPGSQPVIEIADNVLYKDIFDMSAVLALAKSKKIDAVISDQNDMMMPTVAYIAENLGVPGLTIAQVNSYCNKNVFRDNCDKLHIPVPRHIEVHDIGIPNTFLDVKFPWVVKPADAQSSIGVSKVNNTSECLIAIKNALNYSKSNSVIIEEFFEGQELVAEGFIYKGKYYNLGFADRKYFDLNNKFIPSQTIFPSTIDKSILDKIILNEQSMARYMDIAFAIVHSEYLYNSLENKYCIVESGLRGGGVYISSHLVPLYSGIDINDVLIDCACGKTIDIDSIFNNKVNKASAYICFYLPPGIITKIEGLAEVEMLDFVKMICIDDIKIGDITKPLTHKGQRLGPIIIYGNDREDIDNKINIIQNTIKIVVKNDDGKECGIEWD